jgi:hypothetical protein
VRFLPTTWGVWSFAHQRMLATTDDYHDAQRRAWRLYDFDDSVEVGRTCPHQDRIVTECEEEH